MEGTAVINPYENSRKVDRQILWSERLFLIVAMLITSIGFFVWGRGAAAQYTDLEWLQNLLGVIAAVISGFVTDFAFRRFLEEVVFKALAAFHPDIRNKDKTKSHMYFNILGVARWLLLAIVVGALIFADVYSVQMMRDPFADAAKPKPKTDITAATAALNNQLTSASAPLAEQIKTLKKDINNAEHRTESTNASLALLISNGNGWAAREMEKKKNSATKSARKQLAELQTAYNASLTNNSATISSLTTQLNTENIETDEANRRKKYSLSGMYLIGGVGSKIMTVILRIFLVVSFLSKTPTLDVNNDGVVDGRDVTDSARGGSFR